MSNNTNKSFTNKLKNTSNIAKNTAKNIESKAKNTMKIANNELKKSKEKLSKVANNIGKSTIAQSASQGFSKLSNVTKEFESKNSSLSKIIFIIFIFIIFSLLFRLGVYILTLFFTPNPNPIVINGMRPTRRFHKYNVNPTATDPKPILRSINENQGMEFTWSTWLWIDNTDGNNNVPKRIFTKGKNSTKFTSNQITTGKTDVPTRGKFLMNSPGLYLYDPITDKSNENILSVVISLFDESSTSEIDQPPYDIIPIHNIPLQKWINIVIRVQNKTLDIYLNGILTKRKNYKNIIKQNYGDIFVGERKNPLDGYISSLRYFNYALGNNKIQDIMNMGPNLKTIGEDFTETKPPYLAMRWYLDSHN